MLRDNIARRYQNGTSIFHFKFCQDFADLKPHKHSLKTKKGVSFQTLLKIDLHRMTVCMPQKTDMAVSVALSQIKQTQQTNNQTNKRLETSQVQQNQKRGVFSGTLENRSSLDDSLHATKDRRGCFCGITDEFCIFLWCHNHDVLRLWAHYWHRKYHLDFQICLNYIELWQTGLNWGSACHTEFWWKWGWFFFEQLSLGHYVYYLL